MLHRALSGPATTFGCGFRTPFGHDISVFLLWWWCWWWRGRTNDVINKCSVLYAPCPAAAHLCPRLCRVLKMKRCIIIIFFFLCISIFSICLRVVCGHNRGVSPPQILSFLIKSIMKLAGLFISIFIYCSLMIVNQPRRASGLTFCIVWGGVLKMHPTFFYFFF